MEVHAKKWKHLLIIFCHNSRQICAEFIAFFTRKTKTRTKSCNCRSKKLGLHSVYRSFYPFYCLFFGLFRSCRFPCRHSTFLGVRYSGYSAGIPVLGRGWNFNSEAKSVPHENGGRWCLLRSRRSSTLFRRIWEREKKKESGGR